MNRNNKSRNPSVCGKDAKGDDDDEDDDNNEGGGDSGIKVEATRTTMTVATTAIATARSPSLSMRQRVASSFKKVWVYEIGATWEYLHNDLGG